MPKASKGPDNWVTLRSGAKLKQSIMLRKYALSRTQRRDATRRLFQTLRCERDAASAPQSALRTPRPTGHVPNDNVVALSPTQINLPALLSTSSQPIVKYRIYCLRHAQFTQPTHYIIASLTNVL